jgi:DNA-binding transcriptional LysR family regulator
MPQDSGGSEVVHFKPGGPLDCSDGQVLHDWCLGGWGIAWRSTWEVEAEIAAGRLVAVLEVCRPRTAFTWSFLSASTCRCACGCGSITSKCTMSARVLARVNP